MGCGGASNMQGPLKISVYGDLFNTDTRTVLTILKFTEVDYMFKDHERTKDMIHSLGPLYDNKFSDDYIAKVTPVLDEDGVKRIGSGQSIIEYCCFKDQRNAPKLDPKNGKPMKKPKGWKPAVSLNSKEVRAELERKLTWFQTKMRPYSNHLFNTLLARPIAS